MWKIIVSMVMSALGLFLIMTAEIFKEHYGNIPEAKIFFGCLLVIGASVLFLYGLRDFFLRDLLTELNSIKQRIPTPPTAPAASDPKHLCFEPDRSASPATMSGINLPDAKLSSETK